MLLIILGMWLVGAEAFQPRVAWPIWLWVFFFGYVLLVLWVAVWARVTSWQVVGDDLQRNLRRLNRVTRLARWAVPVWLAFGLFGGAGWAQLVLALTGTRLQLPGILLGTLPAILAWVGLWWAEYPVDRALREQSILNELTADLPLHMLPGLGRFLRVTFRQQLLPVVLPVLLIVLLRDVIVLIGGKHISGAQEDIVILPAALAVYLASPEILRRIFDARPMEQTPLRRRLEEICRGSGLRYRDILLWRTDFSIANAAVIGILPRWRYVLLSDRLLETMSDEQIEAVFAHELGHIVHRHMLWFVVFFAILTLGAIVAGNFLDRWLATHLPAKYQTEHYANLINLIGGGAAFMTMLVLFGMLSRRFERQADVFAARMMECNWGPETQEEKRGRGFGHRRFSVGQRGSAIFCSALHRVAVVNNIPLRAKDWFHPSIAKRMNYLEQLSEDPTRTGEFDRVMGRLYVGLIVALVVCGVLVAVVNRV